MFVICNWQLPVFTVTTVGLIDKEGIGALVPTATENKFVDAIVTELATAAIVGITLPARPRLSTLEAYNNDEGEQVNSIYTHKLANSYLQQKRRALHCKVVPTGNGKSSSSSQSANVHGGCHHIESRGKHLIQQDRTNLQVRCRTSCTNRDLSAGEIHGGAGNRIRSSIECRTGRSRHGEDGGGYRGCTSVSTNSK